MMVLDWIQQLTDQLGDWAANWWFLAVVLVIALLDSVIPVVPSETSVIIAAVAVSVGEAPYPLWAVIVAGATGAFLGDNLAYVIGEKFAPRFERRAQRNPKFARRLEWARC
jgi:membrane-associated protein